MNQTPILLIAVPLLTALISITVRNSSFRDSVSFGGSIAYLSLIFVVSAEVISNGALTYQAGGWIAPYGISLVVDELSVIMIMMTSLVSFAANLYSSEFIDSKLKSSGYYGFFHFMVAGMTGAFITGDIFNLFVMFEIILMSSYGMVSMRGTGRSLFASLKYVVINLVGSSLMLVSIGGIYSVTGTLNMADIALLLSQSSVNVTPILGYSSILFCVFGIKSGLVPFHFWAPPVYSNSPPPASAMMAGISKKVGIYALIRLYLTVFSAATIPQGSFIFPGRPVTVPLGYLLIVMSALTILLGGISAINRKNLDKLLSYSSIGQVGFIMMPLGIALIEPSSEAVKASLIYLLGHGFSKSALFMMSGAIGKISGTKNLKELGGLSEKSFSISAAYFIAAFSLVGLPPPLGFFGKMEVFRIIIVSGNWYVVSIMLTGALATLLYFGKSWIEIFFGDPVEYDFSRVSKREVLAFGFLATSLLTLGVTLEPLNQILERSAEAALGTDEYVKTVLGDPK